MIVSDATLLVHFVLPGPDHAAAVHVRASDPEWVVPPLWVSEVRNALLKYVRAGLLPLGRATALVREAENAVSGRVLPVSHDRVLTLAADSGRSAYDCEYVVLAEVLGVTVDRQVLAAFPGIALHPREVAAGGG